MVDSSSKLTQESHELRSVFSHSPHPIPSLSSSLAVSHKIDQGSSLKPTLSPVLVEMIFLEN